MKNIKRIARFILAFALILVSGSGFLSSVSAAEVSNSLTIENTGKTPHTFELYQIFKGDLGGENNQLSNITWGNGVVDSHGFGEASAKADSLTPENVKSFANDLVSGEKLKDATQSKKVAAGSSYTFDNLDAGYYLVKDTDTSQDKEEGAYTLYILKVVGTVTQKTKLDMPSVEKKVKDINDSVDKEHGDWRNTADHDIGDNIPFQLEGTLPGNYDEYESYKYVFHDTQSEGLTFNNDAVVKVDGAKLETGYEVKITDNGFTVTFDDLKEIEGITKNSKITVEYTAKLNENAVIGSTGNPNEVHLEYSNDPNNIGDGTSTTPKDKVIVFTYKLVVNKVDAEKEALTGAGFKLEKKMQDGSYKLVKEYSAEKDKTTFEFKGLDDGQYRLTEIDTPEGYNTIEPIEFKIESTLDDDELTLINLNGNAIEGEVELDLTPNIGEGSLTTDIVNKQGPELPETGGMGTKVIYTLGILLLGGGLIYLAVDRKRSVNN
ncbi:LPXTG-motif cell wall anchor domain-containing protein/fimbrial isopeptide formation D2 domain-containing protein [Alkalibacterium gilvum]|uniref:LPXTG-motif cell wall anchor domain-containing protein/fimbrial isopeptide formation D2 domain-containing protein n=1 Tax=Alkalibacterium gilvum TaxID=1130080 RepID=A0A1H6W0T6_9LACT|nr:isopeptide-forming domain-containing fimbrial protein [Alkalibacterium gilvum]SEJ06430.1 LPXTG-motif cell wall anchor domain-containing protein/fimbrial isopeptide formation D2 domain-containing protein [Alkalibacterium gilvum]